MTWWQDFIGGWTSRATDYYYYFFFFIFPTRNLYRAENYVNKTVNRTKLWILWTVSHWANVTFDHAKKRLGITLHKKKTKNWQTNFFYLQFFCRVKGAEKGTARERMRNGWNWRWPAAHLLTLLLWAITTIAPTDTTYHSTDGFTLGQTQEWQATSRQEPPASPHDSDTLGKKMAKKMGKKLLRDCSRRENGMQWEL